MEDTVEKMVRIARDGTGASVVYADMLLSLLPNSTHKVCAGLWCYKAGLDDFYAMLELMEEIRRGDKIIWEFEKLVAPYKIELQKIAKG